jgi:glycosyltransferase involved in cell wall biosynthesis
VDIAVIIPLYNGAKWIGATLDSVAAQTRAPEEIIVVDDGSTDESPSIANEFSGVSVIENPGGDGPASARNRGARVAEAEGLAFLDQDDLWHPTHLQTLHRALERRSECVGAFSNTTSFQASESPTFSVDDCSPESYNPWTDYPRNRLGQPAGALVRRGPFDRVDGWPTEFAACDDYHLWLKLGIVGDFVRTGGTTAAHRIHKASYSQSQRAEEFERYYERFVDASENALQLRDRMRGDGDAYRPRLDAQKALLDLLKALRRGDATAMREAARNFGLHASQESKPVILNLWNNFVWFIAPIIDQMGMDQFAVEVISLLHDWPPRAERPRRILYEWAVGRASSAELVKRHPTMPRYWRLFLQRCSRKAKTLVDA